MVPRASNLHGASPTNKSRAGLFKYAVDRLFDPEAAGAGGIGPLCVITSTGRAALLDDLADRAELAGWEVIVRDGHTLSREMAAAVAGDRWHRVRERFFAARLVVVQQFESLGDQARQMELRQLLDAGHATVWCFALTKHPLSGHLEPSLASRLAAGLVVTMPHGGLSVSRQDPLEASHNGPREGALETENPLAVAAARSLTIPQVFSATAHHFGISTATLTGSSRSRSVSRARSLAMYLARLLTTASFESIGHACGGRDHTTAMHGSRVTAARMQKENCLAADAEAIARRLVLPSSTRRLAAGNMLET